MIILYLKRPFCVPNFKISSNDEKLLDLLRMQYGKYFDAVMNYPLGRVINDMFVAKTIVPDKFNQALVAKLMKFSDLHNRVQFNLIDSHDTARVLTQADGDKLGLKNAFLFMMLMKGAPCIY